MIPLIIILVVVLAIVIWCVRTVNGFKKKEIHVQEGLSGVEVALTKRYDMLTKCWTPPRAIWRMKTSCSQRSSSCAAA